MRSSPMRSSSSKVARRSLSMSSTAVTFLSPPKTGTTISLREALLQAMCPGKASTSGTTTDAPLA